MYNKSETLLFIMFGIKIVQPRYSIGVNSIINLILQNISNII